MAITSVLNRVGLFVITSLVVVSTNSTMFNTSQVSIITRLHPGNPHMILVRDTWSNNSGILGSVASSSLCEYSKVIQYGIQCNMIKLTQLQCTLTFERICAVLTH